MFFRRKKLWFILHFRTLGTFLVFTKMFTFWVVLWLEEMGMDDPPPITGQYGGKLCHEISPWCGMVLVLELELVLDLVSENLC